MSRILLADDSPHAQRMGERILREEGFEVVSVTDGDTALLRLADVDPDLILADVFLPRKSGFDICRFVKGHPLHRHVRVVMTAGLLEPFDENEARKCGSDAIIKKPFEASAVIETIKPLLAAAQSERDARERRGGSPKTAIVDVPVEREISTPPPVPVEPAPGVAPQFDPFDSGADAGESMPVQTARTIPIVVEQPQASEPAPVPVAIIAEPGVDKPPDLSIARQQSSDAAESGATVISIDSGRAVDVSSGEAEAGAAEIDVDRVRAAVTLALDAAMPELINELTDKILIALGK